MALPQLQFDHFFTYEELSGFLRDIASASPGFCRLSHLGQSRDGRDIPLLTLTDHTTGPPQSRPACLIHAGIHAHEPASTHGALHTAVRLLQDHRPGGLLSGMTFYIIPRLCPDATEFCVSTSARVRSRTDFTNRQANVVYPEDIDGNGLVLTMRQEHPDGNFIIDPEEPRLLVDRQGGAPGPYYRIFPEGYIHEWDGGDQILQGGMHSFFPKNLDLMGGRSVDWNRNWSYNWRPDQIGAGDFPFSEPEVRSLAEFLTAHPKIFAVLGYHCGHASIIRQPASGSRSDLDPDDDAMMESLASLGAERTGTPAVSLTRSFANGGDTSGKAGHSLDFHYHHLGILAFEIELGTVLNNAGLRTEEVLCWSDGDEKNWMRKLMVWWDSRGQQDRIFEPWRAMAHPQLGDIEIGGLLHTQLDNPLINELPATIEGTYAFTIDLAQRRPRISLEELAVDRVGDSTYRVKARIGNTGELASNVTQKGKTLRRVPTVKTVFKPAEGVTSDPATNSVDLGHLAGKSAGPPVEWFVSVDGPDRRLLGELVIRGGAGEDVACSVDVRI